MIMMYSLMGVLILDVVIVIRIINYMNYKIVVTQMTQLILFIREELQHKVVDLNIKENVTHLKGMSVLEHLF